MANLRCDPATIYRGLLLPNSPQVLREDVGGSRSVLNPRFDISAIAADIEWGVDSPGADQLSLAVLCDALGEDAAAALYPHFKFDVVMDLAEEWVLTAADVADWVSGYDD